MKQPRKLTRNQKILLSRKGIDPSPYALQRELPDKLILVEKATGKRREVEK